MNYFFQTNVTYFNSIKYQRNVKVLHILKPSLSLNNFQLPSWIAIRIVLFSKCLQDKAIEKSYSNQTIVVCSWQLVEKRLGFSLVIIWFYFHCW